MRPERPGLDGGLGAAQTRGSRTGPAARRRDPRAPRRPRSGCRLLAGGGTMRLARRQGGCRLGALGRRGSGASGEGCSGAPSASSSGIRGEVLPQRLQHPRRVEGRGRVVDRVQPHRPWRRASITSGWPCRRVIPVGIAPQQLGGEVPERADHGRLDQLDLAQQVLLAVLDLDRLGVAVAGRAALEHVADPHLPPARARSPRAAGRAAGRRGPRRACPARPRWRPGASPTNISSASALPDPNTTVLRVAASSGQRSQARARIRSSFSDSRRAAAVAAGQPSPGC